MSESEIGNTSLGAPSDNVRHNTEMIIQDDDPYDVNDYSDEEEFYYDHYDDFYDYYDAYDYYNEHHK